MAIEIERKYLVAGGGWRSDDRQHIVQGYLARHPVTVRVRRVDGEGWLTIKGPAEGISRREYEYAIPADEAHELLQLCGGRVVQKTRHRLHHAGWLWEIDEFEGANAGLVLAEVELDDEGDVPELPPWLGAEVTLDPRYANASLAERPYRDWQHDHGGSW